MRLARHCRVGLIGRPASAASRIGESLPAAARRILTDLHLWEQFEAAGHRRAWFRRSIWGGPDVSERDSIRDPEGAGWHLERERFDSMLLDAARLGGVQYDDSAWLRTLHYCEVDKSRRWRCEVDTASGPQVVSCRVIVDASGRSAKVVRRAGALAARRSKMVCFYAWLDGCSQVSAGATLIESAPHGWWYSADITDSSCVIAWHTDSDLDCGRPRNARQLADLASCTRLIGERISGCMASGALHVAPAHEQWATPAAGLDWIAVGDACLAFDPLASQGLLHALVTAHEAAAAVLAYMKGTKESLADWDARVQAIRAAYLRHCRDFYALERRWPDAVFWARRQRAEVAENDTVGHH
jgi:flavin-dependent dehydrogenase